VSAQGRIVEAPVLRKARVPLVLEEITVLPPREGEVLVRLVASGVCHSCLHRFDGSLTDARMPAILGDEGAGIIEEVGPGTTGLQPGDHVVLSWAPGCGACKECLKGRPARCRVSAEPGCLTGDTTRFSRGDETIYHNGPSTFSPLVVVNSRAAIKIKDSISLQAATLVGCAVTTGAGAVLRTARVECGQSVAVIGCGGVGLNSVIAASIAGAYPIVAVDPVAIKLDAAQKLGATAVISASGHDIAEAVRSATGGGADVVIVAVGNSLAIEQGVEALAPGGKCVVVGAPPSGEKISVDPHGLRGEERTLMGSSYGSCNPPLDFPMFIELYESGRLPLDDLVSRTYQLSEINEALANLAAGQDLRGLVVFDKAEF
jgi:S-(hydroxymethyl)glutathione dehydrogenase/alcohol dehydrogenase